jgi:hypothetical protein
LLKYRLISAFVLIPVVIAALFLLPPMGFAIDAGGLYARRVGVGATERFHLNVAAGLAGGAVRPSAGGDAVSAAGIPL